MNTEITPKIWNSRQDPKHQDWVKQTFKYDTVSNLFKHQRIVRDYMQSKSPYRGLLMYAGLGVGKTLAAITIAEVNHDLDPIVMLPASLYTNFRSEMKKFSKSNKTPLYIKYNGIRRDQIEDLPNFDNKVIIIDEVHGFISRVVNGSTSSKMIYKKIFEAKNSKIICLSGTPLINYVQEFTLLVNLLIGPQDCYVCQVPKDTSIDKLKSDPSVLNVNQSTQTKITVFLKNIGDAGNSGDIDEVLKKAGIPSNYTMSHQAVLPLNDKLARCEFETLKTNREHVYFRRVLSGLVSYFYYYNPDDFATQSDINFVKVPLSDTQFVEYTKARRVEFVEENPKIKIIPKKLKGNMFCNIQPSNLISRNDFHFKVASRIASNFVVPGVPRNGKTEDYFDATNKFVTKESLKEFAPKMKKIVDRIQKSNGPCLVYSQYRTKQGIGAFAQVLELYGYSEVKVSRLKGQYQINKTGKAKKHYIVFKTNADTSKTQILMDIFNKNASGLPRSIQLADLDVRVILITQAGSEGISLKGVRQVHIMEPYWNYIRVQQIIGRAIRAKSHNHLDPAERHVDVYVYLATLTKDQAEDMKWDDGKLSDAGVSTDETIYRIAKKKQDTLDHLLKMMKETAMDCKIHLKENRKSTPDLNCQL